ncbi:MAG: hypothetical protein PHH77_07715 [Victivallaceae bacterium]|nr:hypothetical protein [Victivallaceae bacterium]
MSVILDTATPALKKLIKTLTNPRAFHKTWGHAVARLAKRNAREKSQGGDFWKGIADSTQVSAVDDRGAIVENRHFAGAHKHFGGTIRAKNVKALTIPINDEAKGKRASEFESGGRKLFVAPGTSVLGYSDGEKFCGLFVLRKSITQAPDPWWPSETEAYALGLKEADYWLEQQGGL